MAELCRDHGLTQAQLGELVGVSHQQIASFEIGRRRVPVSLLATLATGLGHGGSIDRRAGTAACRQTGADTEAAQQLERISQ